MNNFKRSDNRAQSQSKQSIRSKKDDMTNFIESEFNKFKKIKNENPIALNTKYSNVLNDQNINPILSKEKEKFNSIYSTMPNNLESSITTTFSKFPGFKMPDKNYNSNKDGNNEILLNVSGTDFLKSSQSGARTKTPFVMKKFENLETTKEKFMTKEIIEDLEKNKNKKIVFDMEIAKDSRKMSVKIEEHAYVLPNKQYEPINTLKNSQTSVKYLSMDRIEPDAGEDEYYAEDFIDEEDIVKLESFNKLNLNSSSASTKKISSENVFHNPTKYINENKSNKNYSEIIKTQNNKNEEILMRIKNLGIQLEQENFDNMYEISTYKNTENYKGNFSTGHYKNQLTQTNEVNEKSVTTEKIDYKDNYTNTENMLNSNLNKEKTQKEENSSSTEKESLTKNNKSQNTNYYQYQPLSFDTYKFFLKFAPIFEKLISNNINKFILQSNANEKVELKQFLKVKDFVISDELINELNVNKLQNHLITFDNYLFFQINPHLIGFSITITYFNSVAEIEKNSLRNFFNPTIRDNNIIHILVIFNLHTNKEEKVFFSSDKITNFLILGDNESMILAGKSDGTIDIFEIKSINEKFYDKYENKLKLASSTFNPFNLTSIVSIKKRIVENKKKYSKVFIIDASGKLVILDYFDDIINSSNLISESVPNIFRVNSNINLKPNLERIFNANKVIEPSAEIESFSEFNYSYQELLILDFRIKNSSFAIEENFYILCNFGFAKIKSKSKDEIIYKTIFENNQEINKITSFDISDSNLIIFAFADFTIKIYDEILMSYIFSTVIPNMSFDNKLSEIFWADVVCKNQKNKLVKNSLNANFYVITSKNELLIFDLNQKTKAETKKIKAKLDLGAKKNLNKRNSLMAISNSSFLDYSNFVVQSVNKEKKVEIHKLSLRKQFYELDYITDRNEKIKEKLQKFQ